MYIFVYTMSRLSLSFYLCEVVIAKYFIISSVISRKLYGKRIGRDMKFCQFSTTHSYDARFVTVTAILLQIV